MLQQSLFARLQKECGAKRAGGAGVPASEAVRTGIPAEIIIHSAAGLVYEAVVRHGQEREIRGGRSGADLLEKRQGLVKNLLR